MSFLIGTRFKSEGQVGKNKVMFLKHACQAWVGLCKTNVHLKHMSVSLRDVMALVKNRCTYKFTGFSLLYIDHVSSIFFVSNTNHIKVVQRNGKLN